MVTREYDLGYHAMVPVTTGIFADHGES